MTYNKTISLFTSISRWLAIGLLFLAFKCSAQCCEFKLIRKDTLIKQAGIFVVEPPLGKQAKIVFEDLPFTVQENFITFGKWEHPINTTDPFLNKDVYYSNEVNAQLALNFYGSRFQIVTAKASHHGIMTVQLNSGPEVVVDLYSQVRVNDSVVFDSPAPLGTNSIKIKVTGQRNPAATGTWIVIDYVKVQ